MGDYSFRIAVKADKPAIIAFINRHWETRHPLVNLPDFFDYYYKGEFNTLHFALAEQQGVLAAVAGFISASKRKHPDLWVSIWIADQAAKGSGLELMAALPELTGCRTLSCNNIRPKTRAFYEFLGYTTGRMGHFYRLAARTQYKVAQIKNPKRLAVDGNLTLQKILAPEDLKTSGFRPPKNQNPYKDLWYITRRFFHFPHQTYDVWGLTAPCQTVPTGLLVTRTIPVWGTAVLRIADYIGEASLLGKAGAAIDQLMSSENAEYADLYCAGIPASTLEQAGFSERLPDDDNILPNYLNPPLLQNTDYYYFTSRPEGFTMFKADGDQDRPNLF